MTGPASMSDDREGTRVPRPRHRPDTSAAGLRAQWHAESRRRDWPRDLPWDVPATSAVVTACFEGATPPDALPDALYALADERLAEAASPADFARDIEALAYCLDDGPAADELIGLGRHAIGAVLARDHVLGELYSPATSFRSRTAFLADLTGPAAAGMPVHVWTARWRPAARTWSATATQLTVASAVRTALRDGESAAYFGPGCLAVLLTSPGRGTELDELLRGVADLGPVESLIHTRPDGPLERWGRWLIKVFPELIDDPLP
ncbi:hypothetical protein [Amycolatopsis rhizosphaerae]|uniref:hypothetical protein n=1 Tax=Amycolatopsis rhizosphaerae TaxID=2053003 RepID=UPI0011AAF59F|nr:hypothetical protein [Amycolatopsis rhizosphaerae]